MSGLLDRWIDLPPMAKGGIVLASGGGVGAALFMAFGLNALFVFLIGLAILAALVVAYRWVLKRREAKKSKPFESDIMTNSSSTPHSVSDPSKRAQVDKIRARFEEGLSVYRQRGKDIYSVPWYVVIGEPGSGKTAAIRNSGIQFPPGLHEELQGVGGTINMDWFFANEAVLLDTAGRLTFGEVDSAKTSEWKEFLKLLRSARPRCPVNGMLLFIPADTLKQDTTDELDAKASKIASQLELIQQTLGVRFPLFVVVSKADLLLGFSEFFEGMSDPRQQFQMMGWSNPDSLDERFQPRRVQEIIADIRDRLMKRRHLLLREPAPMTMSSKHRLDEVDALYELPEEVDRIGSRLQRYMEVIFSGGAWSSPPPFLRGIYFTSALREGEAMDMALAEAIGIEASEVEVERRWESKRSFFLHDLFTEKVFRERGLVTAAESPSAAKRKRRVMLYGSTAAMLLVAIGLSVWWLTQLYGSLVEPKQRWNEIASLVLDGKEPRRISVLDPNHGYDYTTAFNNVRPRDLAVEAYPDVTSKISAGGLFGLIVRLDDFDSKRARAHEAIFEASVLRPLVERARAKLAVTTTWSDEDVEVLEDMLAIHTGVASETTKARRPDLGRLLGYVVDLEVLGKDDEAGQGEASEDQYFRDHLQGMFDEMYADEGAWPPASLGEWDEAPEAVTRFVGSWSSASSTPGVQALSAVAEAARAHSTAERSFRGQSPGWFDATTSTEAYERERERWTTSVGSLSTSASALVSALDGLPDARTTSLDEITREIRTSAIDDAVDRLDRVLAQLPEPALGDGSDGGEVETPSAAPVELATYIARSRGALRTELGARIDDLATVVREAGEGQFTIGTEQRSFMERLALYTSITGLLERVPEDTSVSGLYATRDLEEAAQVRGGADRLGVTEVVGAIDASGRHWRSKVARGMLDAIDGASSVREVVASLSEESEGMTGRTLVAVPMTPSAEGEQAVTIAREFQVANLRTFGDAIGWLRTQVGADEGAPRVLDRASIEASLAAEDQAFGEFARTAMSFWTTEVTTLQTCRSFDTWASMSSSMAPWSQVASALRSATMAQGEAMEALAKVSDDDSIEKAQASIATRRALLESDVFVGSAGNVYQRWSVLPADASEARSVLKTKSVTDLELQSDYLLNEMFEGSPRTGSSIPFLASVATRAMSLIGSDVQKSLRADGASGIERFPLDGGASQGVSIESLPSLRDLVRDRLEQTTETPANVRLAGDFQWANTAYQSLLNASAGGPSEADLLVMQKILTWIGDGDEVAVRIHPLRRQPEQHEQYQYMTIKVGDVVFKKGDFTISLVSAGDPIDPGVTLPARSTIEFRFFKETNPAAEHVLSSLPDGWSLLREVLESSAAPVSVGTETVYPVGIEPVPGEKACWFGVSFDPPLPIERGTWPGRE